MQLFARVVRHAPPFLLASIHALAHVPSSWAAMVRGDLHALWVLHRGRGEGVVASMPDPEEAPQLWAALAVEKPLVWKVSVAHLAVEVHVPDSAVPIIQELSEEGVCFDCGACFASRAALFGHRARMHDYRNPLRRKVEGTTCQCCLYNFWTRERLVYHVKKAVRCKSYYETRVSDLPRDRQKQLDHDAAGVRRANTKAGMPPRHAFDPPVRCQGPLPPRA